MEKRLYDLDENGPFSNIMPPLSEAEESCLKASLLKDGCLDAVVTWNGVIVDGHNRCRLCKELDIPFEIKEMSFDSEAEAKLWMIKHQLGRRNLPAFLKIELVLPYEPILREEAKKRQGTRNDLRNIWADSPKSESHQNTRDALAEIAGVSPRVFSDAKYVINNADENTLSDLRTGALSIYKARKMTEWHLETADEFTKYRIQKGAVTLEQAYDEFRRREKEELEQLKAQAEQSEHDGEWDEEGDDDYDPTFGGKVVPLFGRQRNATTFMMSDAPMVAGDYISGFSNRLQKNVQTQKCSQPRKAKAEIVSIIPYLEAKGWKQEDYFAENEEDAEGVSVDAGESSASNGDADDSPKAEIISIIPYLKARGRLPMDYEEAEDDFEGYNCDEPVDEDDYEDGAEEEGGYEPVAFPKRIVNIADIKTWDQTVPNPARGVGLMSEDANDYDNVSDDFREATQIIRTVKGGASTVPFDAILSAMEKVMRGFENNVAVLLSAIAPEDRTAENGTIVNNVLNDCMTAVINNYTEVF